MNWEECYYNHFVEYLGKPVETMKSLQNPDIRLTIHDGIPQHVTYCSRGLSNFSNEVGVRCEVFLPVNNPNLDVGMLFIDILTYMVKNSIEMKIGAILSGLEHLQPEFVAYCNKAAIYFTFPYRAPEGFATAKCGEEQGRVYTGIFITEAERLYVMEHGIDAFEDILIAKAKLGDINRPSVV